VLTATPTKFWRISVLSNRFRVVVVRSVENTTVLTVDRLTFGNMYGSKYNAYWCREPNVQRNGCIPGSIISRSVADIQLFL
jgi:hypothetical protein